VILSSRLRFRSATSQSPLNLYSRKPDSKWGGANSQGSGEALRDRGELRGRRIRVPRFAVRPTSDRVREALFALGDLDGVQARSLRGFRRTGSRRCRAARRESCSSAPGYPWRRCWANRGAGVPERRRSCVATRQASWRPPQRRALHLALLIRRMPNSKRRLGAARARDLRHPARPARPWWSKRRAARANPWRTRLRTNGYGDMVIHRFEAASGTAGEEETA
jgi:hypothetical protein